MCESTAEEKEDRHYDTVLFCQAHVLSPLCDGAEPKGRRESERGMDGGVVADASVLSLCLVLKRCACGNHRCTPKSVKLHRKRFAK